MIRKGIQIYLVGVFGALMSCSEVYQLVDEEGVVKEPLRLITWSEYVPKVVTDAFTQETGIPVEADSFGNSEELMSVLREFPDQHDLVIFDNSSVSRFARSQLLQELDRSKVVGFERLDPKFLGTEHDPQNRYSVPYLWGSTLVAYRTDKIDAPEPSFELLFEESLRGRVAMVDDMQEVLAVGKILEGLSMNDHSERALLAAAERLKPGIKNNQMQFLSDKGIREGLASGEIWAALCYSGDAELVAQADHPIGYFFPKEGAAFWLDVMTISRDSENMEAAYAFINFMMRPEISAMTANALHYPSPNRKAWPLLDNELVSNEALVPPPEVVAEEEFFGLLPDGTNLLISRIALEFHDLMTSSGKRNP